MHGHNFSKPQHNLNILTQFAFTRFYLRVLADGNGIILRSKRNVILEITIIQCCLCKKPFIIFDTSCIYEKVFEKSGISASNFTPIPFESTLTILPPTVMSFSIFGGDKIMVIC